MKYGYPVGHATQDVPQDGWIHTHNLKTNLRDDVRVKFFVAQEAEDEEPQAVPELFIGKVLATAGVGRLKHEETGFKEIAIFKTGVTL